MGNIFAALVDAASAALRATGEAVASAFKRVDAFLVADAYAGGDAGPSPRAVRIVATFRRNGYRRTK